MQNTVMMMNVPDIIGKRDIKREFKAAGYGSIDEILFEPETFDGYNTVYVWFRPTTNEEVLEKRNKLQSNVENNRSRENCIYVRIEKTRRFRTGSFEHWFLLPNTDRERPSVSVKKDSQQVTDLMARIAELEERLECNVNTTYQLLGGLFHQTNQRHVLDNCVGYLLRGKHSPVPSGESIWPTTRQGDELEQKVKELEQKVEYMYSKNDTYERKLAALENRFDDFEFHVPTTSPSNDTYERKLAAIEKRFDNFEHRIPSMPNDTFERKLAALEKRFDDCEFQLPSYPTPNDTYDRKLAALEKHIERLDNECSHTTSLAYDIDNRMRAMAQSLMREM